MSKKKIPVSDFIAEFQRMYKEHWSYVFGAAREGTVDCSGAFVFAYSKLGHKISDHSSNAIARYNVGPLGKTPHPGYAAFKWRPDSAGKTPARWKDGKGDYYHIGLVDEDGAHVLNAKGTKSGFSRDTIKAWESKNTAYYAPLKAMDYNTDTQSDGGTDVIYAAIVTTSGGRLNIRTGPSINDTKIGSLLNGEKVDVHHEYDTDEDGTPDWAYIAGDGLNGYVSMQYLTPIDRPEITTEPPEIPVDDLPKEEEETAQPAQTSEKYGVFIPNLSASDAVKISSKYPGAIVSCYWHLEDKPPDKVEE